MYFMYNNMQLTYVGMRCMNLIIYVIDYHSEQLLIAFLMSILAG